MPEQLREIDFMQKKAAFIYPNQLFENNPLIEKDRIIFLVEDKRYFSDFNFHKKKLVLHRASMQAYKEMLVSEGCDVIYIEWKKSNPTATLAVSPEEELVRTGVKELFFIDPADKKVESDLHKLCENLGIRSTKVDNPGFLSSKAELERYFKDSDKFSFTPFYIEQRKKQKILVNSNKKPVGGKWSFDPENRLKIPPDIEIPGIKKFKPDKYVKEAQKYVEKIFSDNPGSTENFIFPIIHSEVREWFRDFLENRFSFFGDYEDAIKADENYLFHSVISFALNTGLITPAQVVDETLEFSSKDTVSLNSLEGFIRQVIGWREYIRAVYELKEDRERNTNYFGFTNPLPEAFYNATTGVDPVDTVIKRVLNTAYSHHIERLMVMGNFMLLCEISPDEVYRWFMELYIDAYDWVMVPNVYGMSQFADGGLIMTKPYISSSNYIKKMSDFEHGEWCDTWDALYWRFICKHKKIFDKNPRSRLMVRVLERKSKEQLNKYLDRADNFLEKLFKE